MAVAARGPNTEIMQFDWFISGLVFPILPTLGNEFKKPSLHRIKIKIFDTLWSESALQTIRREKVTMLSLAGEEILYEMMTELQVFIGRLYLCN